MLGRTDSRARALLVLIGFVLVAGSLGVRLAYWQVGRHDELSAQAVRQSSPRASTATGWRLIPSSSPQSAARPSPRGW